MSTRTGAPNARARALGVQDRANGTAVAAIPTAATPEVASNKYLRVIRLDPESVNLVDSPYHMLARHAHCFRKVSEAGEPKQESI